MAAAAPRPFRARALLSDLDGTLLDTEPLYFAAYKAAVESFGVAYDAAFHVEHLLGRPEAAGVAAILALLRPPCDAAALVTARDAALDFSRVAPCAGAAAAVRALRGALPAGALAVATSSKERLVRAKRAAPEADALVGEFAAVVCADSPAMAGKRGKPAPDAFLAAAAAIGAAPEDCVVFEDSLAGIAAGAAAGCFVVAVPDARLPAGAAAAAGAHVVLASLLDFRLEMVGL
jgi:beta-phosphoglucomutase-like phosphatase (HAD superfamily)